MEKHSFKASRTDRTSRRVGRGGKRGKTSGKGMKGQKSRTGNSTRPELRDIIKKFPKRRGYGKNRARTVVSKPRVQAVNVGDLAAHFSAGSVVSSKALVEKGMVSRVFGKAPKVKLLARGTLDKKLTLQGIAVSEAARRAVEKAGGTVA